MNGDWELLKNLDGIHTALLGGEEYAALLRLREAGLAQIVYTDTAGFLGLSRVKLLPKGEGCGDC